jgi:hypothetical protein
LLPLANGSLERNIACPAFRWDHVFGTYPKDSYQEKADDLEAKA